MSSSSLSFTTPGGVGTIVLTPTTLPERRTEGIDLFEEVIKAEASSALVQGQPLSLSSTVETEENSDGGGGGGKKQEVEGPVPLHKLALHTLPADEEKLNLPDDDMFFVGMDLEGVDLGRAPGTLELISLSVWNTNHRYTFVIDAAAFFFNSNPWQDKGIERDGRRLLDILENLLNHKRCITVLHDCRRDCDALWHHLKLKPRRVHDTSAVHWVLTGQEHVNLNSTLERWGMPINSSRGRIDYISQPTYWAKRPLTREMVHYAAGDVHSLIPMARLQKEAAIAMDRFDQVQGQSEFYRDCLQGMERTWVECKVPMGKFFGRGGSAVRLTEKRTGCFFYQSGSAEERNAGFQVYHCDEDGLHAARRALGWR